LFEPIRQLRNLPRYHQIVSVLARHGFGSALAELQIRRLTPVMHAPVGGDHLNRAEHFRQALEELGPTFVKLGQILSTRPDLIPADFITELEKLQDSVTPTPWEQIEAELETQYGQPLEQVFARIDHSPLGSASLAQVHAAELLDGSQVVIKVQRPDITKTIDADMDILFDMAQVAQRSKWGTLFNPREVVAEFARTLRNELDYHQEGLNIERFQNQFATDKQLIIPDVYWEYSGKTVLVMKRLVGIKIDDFDGLEQAGFDRHDVAGLAARIVAEEVMANGFFHADPHPGNFFVTPLNGQSTRPQPVIGLMDFGMVGYISDNDRLTIIQAYSLAMRDDTQGIVDLMLRVGAVSTTDDLESLERDLNRMLHTYRGLPLKHIQAGPLVNELMQMAFRYHIKLPADMWLLFKTVAMMEGLAQRLDPEFNVFAEFAPHAKRILLEQRMPWVWGATFLDDLQSLIYTARDIPSVGKSILRSFQRGEFPLAFSMGLNKETLNRLDRITTRLSLSLLATAFILGLAILLPVAQASKVAAVLVSIGFAVALVLGLWLAWSILRPGK